MHVTIVQAATDLTCSFDLVEIRSYRMRSGHEHVQLFMSIKYVKYWLIQYFYLGHFIVFHV
jgi:hypothetical protein